MIDAWTWPALMGVLLGTIGFVTLFIPVLVWESKRFGQIRFSRLVGAAMVSVFGVALLAYTLLPLPDQQWCDANRIPGRNLTPFAFVGDLLDYLRAHGARALLTSFVFLQVAFNVLLFVPWGALMRRYFGRGIAFSALSGLAVSVLIEATQTTGAFGLLPCRYRVGDVDDVILNATGALLGALLAPVLLFFMPDPVHSARTRGLPRPVTRFRRLVGMLIDAALFTVVPSVLLTGFRIVRVFLLGLPASEDGEWAPLVAAAIGYLVVVVLPVLVGGGASLGQRAMWLTPRWPTPPRAALAIRLLVGVGGWGLLSLIAMVPGSLLSPLASLGAAGLAVASVVGVLVDRTARGLSLRAAGADLVDSRKDD